MAVSGPYSAHQAHKWYGLSTDTKPLAVACAPGDIFEETDTSYIYYRTATAWVLQDAGSAKVADQTLHSGEFGSAHPLENAAYWSYAVINATGATVVYSGSCAFGGWEVMGAAGAFTMDVYDNTAASGQKLVNGQSVAAAASSRRDSGIKCLTGITVNMSGDPTDAQVLIFYKAL